MTKEDEKADMIEILFKILEKYLGKEKAKKYIKMLEGGMNMGTFVNELRTDRERTILEWRIGIGGHKPKTQHEIASMMGISRSYVSRIETKAIDKLSKEIKEWMWNSCKNTFQNL